MNEAFEYWNSWWDGFGRRFKCSSPESLSRMSYIAGQKAVELRVSKSLGGMPESELWGDDGLIAATMRGCAAYDNLIEDCKLVRAIACGEEQVADNDADALAFIYDLLKDPCEKAMNELESCLEIYHSQ